GVPTRDGAKQSNINELASDILGSSSSPSPLVSLTTPSPSTTLSGRVSVNATASVSSGSITNITLKANGTTIGSCSNTGSCSVSWDTTTVANGSYSLEAVATASDGMRGNTTENVSVSNQKGGKNPTPNVTITRPSTDAVISGNRVTVSANASVARGATIVSTTLKAGSTTLATCSTTSCSASWNTTSLSNGTYTIEADTSASDHKSATTSETVTVSNVPTSVRITAPTAGNTVSGVVPVAMQTAGTIDIVRVQLVVNDRVIDTMSPATSNTYNYDWDTSQLVSGSY